MRNPRIGVTTSGCGPLLKTLVANDVPVALVLSDRPCPAIDWASEEIPNQVIDRRHYGYVPGVSFVRRNRFTERFTNTLRHHNIDLVVTDDFETFFTGLILDQDYFADRILSSQVALFPAFRVARAVREALALQLPYLNVTITRTKANLYQGDTVARIHVPVEKEDTFDSLCKRVEEARLNLYLKTIREFAERI